MSQDQTLRSQATMTTECPVCGVHAWIEAPTCPACGTALRALDPDRLFTTVGVDNAEVVPSAPSAIEGDDGTVDDAEVVDEVLGVDEDDLWDVPSDDEDLWGPAEPVSAPVGGAAFSAEPSVQQADVIDVEEVVDDDLWDSVAPASEDTVADRPLFRAPAPSDPVATPSAPPDDEHADLWDQTSPTPRTPPVPAAATAADPHGLTGALERIDPDVVDRAAVPLAVVSVLLDPGEVVDAALVGEMLGHPAAVVVTARRAVVANGRRWSPVVDVFELDASVDVRGRHDGGVAAVTLMDADRIVTVDGISDVPLAMHFADLVRSRTRP